MYRIVVGVGATFTSYDADADLETVLGWAGHMVRWTPCEAYIYLMDGEESSSVAMTYTEEHNRGHVRVNRDNLRSEFWNEDSAPPRIGDVRPAR